MQKLFRLSLAPFVPAAFFVFLCAFYRIPLPPSVELLLAFLFAAGICLSGFLKTALWEQTLASEGIAVNIRDRILPLPALGLIVLAAGTGGLLLSSNGSLFPPEYIAAFFRRLMELISGLFRPPVQEGTPLPAFEELPPMPLPEPVFMTRADQKSPWPYWGLVWKLLKYSVLALALVLFLWFMIYPLLKKPRISLGGISLLESFRRFIALGLYRALHFFAFLAALIQERPSALKILNEFRETPRRGDEALENYSPEKRKEIRRGIHLFSRLIFWGKNLNVEWRAQEAPGEFCADLAAAVEKIETLIPHSGASIIRCGRIFEKSLYSGRPLSTDERREFETLVREITGGTVLL
jgi:hypothetical protein